MEQPTNLAAQIRHGLLEHLELLADPGAQVKYQQDVPIADVPAELVCGWFDDLYHPDSVFLQSAFTEAERDALARFNADFDRLLAEIEEPLPPLDTLQSREAWQAIMAAARATLRQLGGATA